MEEVEELRKTVELLQELGEDWKKNTSILKDAKSEEDVLTSIKRLCRENNQGNMAKIGLTLIAFPFPIIIDDVLGWSFLAAGLIQRRIKNSALYLGDINKTIPQVFKELDAIRREVI